MSELPGRPDRGSLDAPSRPPRVSCCPRRWSSAPVRPPCTPTGAVDPSRLTWRSIRHLDSMTSPLSMTGEGGTPFVSRLCQPEASCQERRPGL